jgi:hypothetical protein
MPFNNDSWLKYQQAIAQKAKELEDLLVAETNNQLTKGMSLDKAIWLQKQRAGEKALATKMLKDINRVKKEIDGITTEGLQYAIDTSTKDLVKIVENKEAVENTAKLTLKAGVEQLKQKNASMLQTLYAQAIQDFRATIPKVELDQRGLFDTIKNAVQNRTDNGFVVYTNNRKVSFKSYMEMSVRTEMSQNAQFNLEQSAKAAGVEVYAASAHGDCADDHVDFQGYYYLADGVAWREEFEKYNFHPKYKYLSEVKALGFLTRPNCRHFVQPVTLDQLKNPAKIRESLKMPYEKASKAKQEALVEQRYNERMIRKYKARTLNDKVMLNNLPENKLAERKAIQERIKQNNQRVRAWSKNQQRLIDKSGLKRQRNRERPGVIVHDLGARMAIKKAT